LRSEGVDTSNVEIINRSRTGLALVSVYDSGENSITVIPGANFQLTADRVTRSVERLTRDAGSAVVVVQAELVTDIITATATAAERAGARLVLNLAPYQPLAAHVLAACNPLVLNEAEASALVGWKVTDAATAARACAADRPGGGHHRCRGRLRRGAGLLLGPRGAPTSGRGDRRTGRIVRGDQPGSAVVLPDTDRPRGRPGPTPSRQGLTARSWQWL